MTLGLTQFDPMLKEHYVDKKVYHLADLKNPFLGTVDTNPSAGGDVVVQPIDYDNPGGGSADIAKAISNSTSSKYKAFLLTRASDYQVALIDNQTIEASKSNRDAFLPALKEVDKAYRQMGRRLETTLFRSRGNSIARLASTTTLSSAVAVLDDISDAFNFQIGQKCAFALTDGTSGALLDSGSTLTVTAIDRKNKEITFSGLLNTIASITTTSWIFRDGDFGLGYPGLADWLPTDRTVLSSSFFGVTRSDDEDRLGGLYLEAGGAPLDEALQDAAAEIGMHGGDPDTCWMNPLTMKDLLVLVGSKDSYEKSKVIGRANVGFRGALIQCGDYEVMVRSSVGCPRNKFYMLQSNTWTLHSAGQCPMFLQRDSLLQRSATADAYEVRVGGYMTLGCSAPAYNLVGDLS